jgi:hypothetical protein
MARCLAEYQPRAAEHGVSYRVIGEHLEPFLDAAAQHADGHWLPKFVEQEFRDFLTCGVLEHTGSLAFGGRLRLRAARALLVQGPRLLPELRGPAHDRVLWMASCRTSRYANGC